MEDDKSIIELVQKCDAKIFEFYRVRRYKGYRKMPDDSVHHITMEVLEDSTDDAAYRFQVTVKDDDTGAEATGNGGDDMRTALVTLHWGDLDKPPVQ